MIEVERSYNGTLSPPAVDLLALIDTTSLAFHAEPARRRDLTDLFCFEPQGLLAVATLSL